VNIWALSFIYILIFLVLDNGKYSETLEKSIKLLDYVQMNSRKVLEKNEIIAIISGHIGNSYLEIGNYIFALKAHQTDLDISKEM